MGAFFLLLLSLVVVGWAKSSDASYKSDAKMETKRLASYESMKERMDAPETYGIRLRVRQFINNETPLAICEELKDDLVEVYGKDNYLDFFLDYIKYTELTGDFLDYHGGTSFRVPDTGKLALNPFYWAEWLLLSHHGKIPSTISYPYLLPPTGGHEREWKMWRRIQKNLQKKEPSFKFYVQRPSQVSNDGVHELRAIWDYGATDPRFTYPL